jgi:hypothetical protein
LERLAQRDTIIGVGRLNGLGLIFEAVLRSGAAISILAVVEAIQDEGVALRQLNPLEKLHFLVCLQRFVEPLSTADVKICGNRRRGDEYKQ